MLAVLHDQDLINDQVFLRLLFQVHLLDGHALVRANLKRSKHATGCTLSNLIEVSVSLDGIRGIADLLQLVDDLLVLGLALPVAWPWSGTRHHAWVVGWDGDGLGIRLHLRGVLLSFLTLTALELLLLICVLSRNHGLLLFRLVLLWLR